MSKKIIPEKGTVKVGGSINTISLKKAQKWAKRWVKKEGNYNKHHKLNAFLIPAIDLKELLEEGGTHVRAYIGVQKIKSEKKGDKPTYVEKLMFVGTKLDPVTGVYLDMISLGNEDINAAAAADDIYDFTEPCPPACDPSSPLQV
jgi:hypothetical protein